MRRRLIDPALLDFAKWPELSTVGMSPKAAEVTGHRILALRLYLQGKSHAEIRCATGLDRRRVHRYFNRAIEIHPDGRILGFRACGYYRHFGGYHRAEEPKARTRREPYCYAGLLRRLFGRFPEILETVVRAAYDNGAKSFTESAPRGDKLHALFISECRKAGIRGNEYPFTAENLGACGLARFLRAELASRNLKRHVDSSFGEEAARRLGHTWTPVRMGMTRQCLERVEFDGHRIDCLCTLEIEDPAGGLPVFLPLERLWLLVAIDAASRAIIGYHVCFGRHYTAEDVLTCFQNALVPWKPLELTVPGLKYSSGSGLPSGVIPELAYARWAHLGIDNDKSNCAAWVWERVRDKIGCVITPGPARTPERRRCVERFFGTLAKNVFQRLPTTTGRKPDDPKRRDPERVACLHKVTVTEMLEVIDVMVADYNACPTSGLYNRSPLEYLRFAVEQKSILIRHIPEAERNELCLTLKRSKVKVRGNLRSGIRPHLYFEGVRYYSERLANTASLIDQTVCVECNTRDLRTLKVFLENGEEFGSVTASQKWAFRAHDLRTRKAILRCIRLGRFARRDRDDPVAEYMKYKATEAMKAKKPRNELAHALRVREASVVRPEIETSPNPDVDAWGPRSSAPRVSIPADTLNY